MRNLKHFIEYSILVTICFVFGLLPLRISGAIWRFIALILYRLLPSLARIARQNIRYTIGQDWSSEKVEETVKQTFIHCGYFIAEFINTKNLGPDFNKYVSIEGIEHLDQALHQGSGVILITGHFGHWEVLGHSTRILGYHLHVFYKKMSNPYVDKIFYTYRSRYSEGLIEIGNYKEKSRLVLEKNEIIGIIPDQDARHHGIFVDFLGQPASTYIGPILLSQENNAPMVCCFFWREKLGQYRLVFEPIEQYQNLNDQQEQISFLTQQWVKKLDKYVRMYPEQYFWFHHRWKTKPC